MKRVILGGIMAALMAAVAFGQAKQPAPKSQKELEALQAMFGAQTADARIAAAENVITKFADTDFKSLALFFIAMSYEQKNDFEKMAVYAERTLEADPKHYQSMIMLARNTALRTREHDLDKEEKLARAEKYAKMAQETLKTAEKPNPQLTDEQWAGAKKEMEGQTHEAMALAAMARKKYDVAVGEFKIAVESSPEPDPATQVRYANALNMAGKVAEAEALLDKILAAPNLHPAIKQFAQAEKARAAQLKGGSAPASGAPAPAQIEIKK